MSMGGLGYFEPLPAELIEQILLHLPPDDLLAAKRLNKALDSLISESVELQYACTLSTHGLVDGPSPLSKHAKLVEARRREEAWRTLDLSRRTTVRVAHHASHIYDLCGGVYMLGQSGPGMDMSKTVRLGAFELDSVKEEDGFSVKERMVARDGWRYLNVPDQIVDVGMCLREYDLIGVVGIRSKSSTMVDSKYSGDVVLHLVQYSTNEPHPLAEQPEIVVSKEPNSSRKLSLMMEIVGPCLVLLLSWHRFGIIHDEENMDELLLINWWTSEIVLKELIKKDTYHGFVFLTPSLLLVPNAVDRVFDVIELPELSATKRQPSDTGDSSVGTVIDSEAKFRRIARLGLPRLNFSHINNVTSRADPNPFGAVHPKCASGEWRNKRERNRPFSADPEKALVLLQLLMNDNNRGAWARPSLIIPRDKLVEAVHRYARPRASRQEISIQHDLESEMGETDDKFGASGLPDSEDALGDVSNSGGREGEDKADDGYKDCSFVSWRMWAPGFTRWCVGSESHSVWITTTAGERYVGLRSMQGQLVVKDFNPYHVRKVRNALEAVASRKRAEAEGDERPARVAVPVEEDSVVRDGFVIGNVVGEFVIQMEQEQGEGEDEDGEDEEEEGDDAEAEWLDNDDDNEEENDMNVLRLDEQTTVRLVDAEIGASGPSSRLLFDEYIDWEELPYVEITKKSSSEQHKPRGVLIDEDRIITLKHDRLSGAVAEFDVFTL